MDLLSATLELAGDIEAGNVSELKSEVLSFLNQAHPKELVLEASKVTKMDREALAQLAALHDDIAHTGCEHIILRGLDSELAHSATTDQLSEMLVRSAATAKLGPELANQALLADDDAEINVLADAFHHHLRLGLLSLAEENGYDPHAPSQPPQGPEGKLLYAGVIGFAADEFQGVVAIQMRRDVMQKFYPSGTDIEPNENALRDWVGELANQLLGRVKNGLLLYGHTFMMGTPTAVTGTGLNLSTMKAWRELKLHSGLSVMFDLSDPDLSLSIQEAANTAMDEGELMLF